LVVVVVVGLELEVVAVELTELVEVELVALVEVELVAMVEVELVAMVEVELVALVEVELVAMVEVELVAQGWRLLQCLFVGLVPVAMAAEPPIARSAKMRATDTALAARREGWRARCLPPAGRARCLCVNVSRRKVIGSSESSVRLQGELHG